MQPGRAVKVVWFWFEIKWEACERTHHSCCQNAQVSAARRPTDFTRMCLVFNDSSLTIFNILARRAQTREQRKQPHDMSPGHGQSPCLHARQCITACSEAFAICTRTLSPHTCDCVYVCVVIVLCSVVLCCVVLCCVVLCCVVLCAVLCCAVRQYTRIVYQDVDPRQTHARRRRKQQSSNPRTVRKHQYAHEVTRCSTLTTCERAGLYSPRARRC